MAKDSLKYFANVKFCKSSSSFPVHRGSLAPLVNWFHSLVKLVAITFADFYSSKTIWMWVGKRRPDPNSHLGNPQMSSFSSLKATYIMSILRNLCKKLEASFINVLQIGYLLTLPNLQKVWMKGSIFWVCTKADKFQFRPVVGISIGTTSLGPGGWNANERC